MAKLVIRVLCTVEHVSPEQVYEWAKDVAEAMNESGLMYGSCEVAVVESEGCDFKLNPPA